MGNDKGDGVLREHIQLWYRTPFQLEIGGGVEIPKLVTYGKKALKPMGPNGVVIEQTLLWGISRLKSSLVQLP